MVLRTPLRTSAKPLLGTKLSGKSASRSPPLSAGGFLTGRPARAADGRNPRRTGLKPRDFSFFVGMYIGIIDFRVSQVVQDFVHPLYFHVLYDC